MDILLLILCIFIILIVLISNFEINNFKITQYKIKTDKINTNIKFAVLSDLHNRKYDLDNLSIYGAIDSMAPNIVFIVGDMINKGEKLEYENTLPLIKKLSLRYKVVYVFGNHEQKMTGKIDKYVDELKQTGVMFLKNEMLENNEINIYGIEIGEEFYRKFIDLPMSNDYINNILGVPDREKFNLVLAHNPVYFEKYSKWGADLVISGHMHGGMVNLPLVRGVLSPQMIFFPRYSSGYYENGNSKLIVGRGIGSHTVNLRIFNRPEIVLVEIIR